MMVDRDGFPRRNRVELMTSAEVAIVAAMRAVEEAGADPLLTEASDLLSRAKRAVSAYVDGRLEGMGRSSE